MGMAFERLEVQPTTALVWAACRWLVAQAGRYRSMVVRLRRCRPAIETPDSHLAAESHVPLQSPGPRVRQWGRSRFGPPISLSSRSDQVAVSFAADRRKAKPANYLFSCATV